MKPPVGQVVSGLHCNVVTGMPKGMGKLSPLTSKIYIQTPDIFLSTWLFIHHPGLMFEMYTTLNKAYGEAAVAWGSRKHSQQHQKNLNLVLLS